MNRKIKVHIIGIHGVPAKYGGLETFADFLCQNIGEKYDITVYCTSKKYPLKEKYYFGAKLKYVPIHASGFKGIFYDLFTYIYAIFKADVILYLSPVGSGFMTPLKKLAGAKVIVNHGGLNEWEREKLNRVKQLWAKFNHKIASRYSDINVVDNELYQQSLKENFGADSVVIRYGGDHAISTTTSVNGYAAKYPFLNEKYAISISRAQVDNNLHLVLEAFEKFEGYKLVLLSNWSVSEYGKKLKQKYQGHKNIIVLDNIYNKDEFNYVRGGAFVYIHSHSRCGTAPSLVEAMSIRQPIISYDVPTNRETTQNQALFFDSVDSLVNVLDKFSEEDAEKNKKIMHSIASENYTWRNISKQYSELFEQVITLQK